MNYYTYTIWFVDGYYYHGYSRYKGKNPLNDGYYGSPTTHKEKWVTTMHWKKVTGTYETLNEATLAEQDLIRPVFRDDPFCLNAACNGAVLPECREKGRQTARERGSGFFDPEFQQSEMMQEVRKKNGKKSGDLASVTGQLAKARAGIDPEKRKETCRQTALKLQSEGRGLGAIPFEERSQRSKETVKKTNFSKWADPNHPEIGTHNPGNLVKLQKKLGLPHGKENRARVG